MPHPRFTPQQIAEHGKQLYDARIRADVEAGNRGKYLVINIETGEYEIDADHLAASDRAYAKHPGAALFALRIGNPARLGATQGAVQA